MRSFSRDFMYPADWSRQRFLTLKVLSSLSSRIPGFRGFEPEGRTLAKVAVDDLGNYLKLRPPPSHVSLDDYIDLWAERWLDKWRERVKLVLRQQDAYVFARHERLLRETAPLWQSFPHLSEALELVMDALIDVGELCFTNLLAESTLRAELMEVRRPSRSLDEALRRVHEGALALAKSAMLRARSYRHFKGYLVWLKVGDEIWRTSLGRIAEPSVSEEDF